MHPDHGESFGTTLRGHRERAGLSQEELAERAGLTRNAISALERGERQRPYPHTVRALAAALGLGSEQRDRFVRLARGAAAPPAPPADVRAIVESLSLARAPLSRPPALPAAPNALIGREREVLAIKEALANPACRLVTVSGPGGAGKTRLALQVAADLASQFADGALWVPLASVAAPEQIPGAVADLLGVPLQGDGPSEQLLAALAERRLLLVLDNFEHLLAGAALLADLLEQAPTLRLLVTSRERLRIAGEWVFDLDGLLVQDPAADGIAAAVQLFAQRARQQVHDFSLSPADSALVTRICRLVEGMPLAIELAATWVGVLSLSEIGDEIARSLDFLAAANRDAPDRHRSLQAVFDHSWHLLSPQQQQVFARLALFRGGFNREAAAHVAGASLPVLAALVDKSLLRCTVVDRATRYDLHELVRQYALARLEAHPEDAVRVRDHHCAYYAQQLGSRTELLQSDGASEAWAAIGSDLDNIRAAWAWAVERRDYAAFAQMGTAMHLVCLMRGLFDEGLATFRAAATSLQALLAAPQPPPHGQSPEFAWTLGHLLSRYGNWAAWCGRFGEARERLQESYRLLAHRNDLLVAGGTLFSLGYMNHLLGDYAEAEGWFARSADLSRAHGNSYFTAASESLLALVMHARGTGGAVARARAALDDWQRNGQPSGRALGLLTLSVVLIAEGAFDEAESAVRDALQLAVGVQDVWMVGLSFLQLGALALGRGDVAAAAYLVDESLKLLGKLRTPLTYGRAMVTRGWVARAAGDDRAARSWFEQAAALGSASEIAPVRLDAQYALAVLAADEAPGAALAYLEQVVAHRATTYATRVRALQLQQSLGAGSQPAVAAAQAEAPRLPGGEVLTPRELEVLTLLARGRSNQGIADELVVAVGTVKRHVNSILAKLAVASRLEAVARARELGLL